MWMMNWLSMCLSMHRGCLLIYIILKLVCSPKDHYSQYPDVTANFVLEFLMYHLQNIMLPSSHQNLAYLLGFWHIPRFVTMLELCLFSSVADPSEEDLEHSFFEPGIQLPLVVHPFFFASRVHLRMLIINRPRRQTSIKPSC